MTLPRAAIVFNSSTGSDTAASGLGPATAVSGSAAAHTGGVASTTVSFTNTPDLSGVVAGDLLWLDTASGRQYSVIASVNDAADTVTVDDSFNIANTGGARVNYAIGGKRATFNDADSRTIFGSTGAKAGWTVRTETDQALTATAVTLAAVTGGFAVVEGDSTTTHRVITQGANAACFVGSVAGWRFRNLKFANSNATKTSARGFDITTTAESKAVWENCIFGDGTNTLLTGIERTTTATNRLVLIDCEVRNCTSDGLRAPGGSGGRSSYSLHGCWVHDNGGNGVLVSFGGTLTHLFVDCLIEGNTGDGVNFGTAAAGQNGDMEFIRCTIHGNGGDGVDNTATTDDPSRMHLDSCNITANGGYGIRSAHATPALVVAFVGFNDFGTGATANTSGDANWTLASGYGNLNVDPAYTATGSNNFGVGTSVKAKGFPDSTRLLGANQSGTTSYADIGAAQRQEAAAGGGVIGGPNKRGNKQ